jgi:hypothetical protein
MKAARTACLGNTSAKPKKVLSFLKILIRIEIIGIVYQFNLKVQIIKSTTYFLKNIVG